MQVNEIPRSYNGNIIFELPPTYNEIKRMEGMEQKFDGHLWTRPHTTNMSIYCTVRLSNCLGSMECHRITCPYFSNNRKFDAASSMDTWINRLVRACCVRKREIVLHVDKFSKDVVVVS